MDVTRGSFVTLDGLSASGKTTVAPLVATLLGGVHLTDDALPTFPRMRAEVDATGNLPARFHWWMMANHLKSETARTLTESGRTVVVESYFPRTVATHRAMGHDCAPEYPGGALVPNVAILLEVDERVRQDRLRRRAERGTLSYWHQREEPNIAESTRVYRALGLVRVDGTDRTPEQVADAIVDIVRSHIPKPRIERATSHDRN
ncbi:AAA family ATPase [Kitasatospora sp. NPDC094028]